MLGCCASCSRGWRARCSRSALKSTARSAKTASLPAHVWPTPFVRRWFPKFHAVRHGQLMVPVVDGWLKSISAARRRLSGDAPQRTISGSVLRGALAQCIQAALRRTAHVNLGVFEEGTQGVDVVSRT